MWLDLSWASQGWHLLPRRAVLRSVYLSLPIHLKLIRHAMYRDASFYRMSFSTSGGDVTLTMTNFLMESDSQSDASAAKRWHH